MSQEDLLHWLLCNATVRNIEFFDVLYRCPPRLGMMHRCRYLCFDCIQSKHTP